MENLDLISIIGPTAVGKTTVAAHLAAVLDGEILSADSRQVYRGMDLGTGKDYADYLVNGKSIPYHLIDIVDAGYKYSVFEFQNDFIKAYYDIKQRGRMPILCGGTGMYIDAVVKGYKLMKVPINDELRSELELLPEIDLEARLTALKSVHNHTDFDTRKRLIRAIEIELYQQEHQVEAMAYPQIKNIYFGITVDRNTRRKRITERLHTRLRAGMVEEVEALIKGGVPVETMLFYGLEYKFIAMYILDQITYDQMVEQLNVAIHQFAKRQTTWFRKMERDGNNIHLIDGMLPMEEKIAIILQKIG
ncbi:tRNA (adenosine(37)-N6)-dimethylallyltransferase MiaA [Williamwhitmania taraxaci]|uniref:tRNA dimethylallyltransferase n=1 Tax=Williamwhitmania taraxaci TaxID=1640674 RepID=A0A1G6LPF7_9BACT|nr:tRNA (adenosine(37)-N6)-dimethylallyltransferase MiaA [Williamwhitmania taraxaci]SDC45140.1 tRNA dimethylallyltransferase [Williamwhitmania taraxaci]